MADRKPILTQEDVDKKLGIICPECSNTAWEITHTRANTHRVVRYRRCRICGAVVRTEEFLDRRKKK